MISRRLIFTLIAGALAVGGCSKKEAPTAATTSAALPAKPPEAVKLNGAGATFPFPLYSKWSDEFHKQEGSVQINYQSIGSGGGIRQIVAGTVDFGATDAPMSADEEKKAPGKLLHLPTTLGAVAVAYQLAEAPSGLKLGGDVLADIYLGKITKWNDARIKKDNADLKLPASEIRVVGRSDGSGTTAVFTDYLSAISPAWSTTVGAGKSVKWPVGLGAKGNEGVAGQVKSTPGSIGYVELSYALQTGLSVAAVRNQAGNFITPSIDAVTAAAEGIDLPDSLHASIVNAKGDKAYPISSYTYLLVYQDAKDVARGQALGKFLWWALHDGQKYAAPLNYAPLPAKVVTQVEAALKQLRAGGKPILTAP